MAFDITNFRSAFSSNGLSSPAHFEVNVLPPLSGGGITNQSNPIGGGNFVQNFIASTSNIVTSEVASLAGGVNAIQASDLLFLAMNATIPGRQLAQTQYKDYGNPYSIVQSEYTPTQLNIDFIVPRGIGLQQFFTAWQGLAIDEYTFDVGYYNDYIGKCIVTKYDPYGDQEGQWTFNEVYPSAINGIDLNWDAVNQVCKMSVGFTYRTWSATFKGMSAGQRILNVGSSFNALLGKI